MRGALPRSLRLYVVIAVAVTALTGLVFIVGQQELRDAANDPQIQMAEDTAARLTTGSSVTGLVSNPPVDVASSLAPFLIVYDGHDDVVASSAVLDGRTPRLPAGVITSARTTGEDRVTWEPKPGVRIAAVVVPYRGGAVLAGRSLREVERRESDLLAIVAVAWLFTLGAVAVTILVIDLLIRRRRTPAL